MHSLSKELLSTKVLHLKDADVMDKKRRKLMALPKNELQTIAIEVRSELNQAKITDVLMASFVKKAELVNDIMFSISNSVSNNFKNIFGHGRKDN